MVIYEWDEEKRIDNLAKHAVDIVDVIDFEWDTALVVEDGRRTYGEPRYIAYGMLGIRLMVLVFTPRGEAVRIISFRKANKREEMRYGQDKTIHGGRIKVRSIHDGPGENRFAYR